MKSPDLPLNSSDFREFLTNQTFKSLRTNEERIRFIVTQLKPLDEFRKETFADADKHCGQHRKSLQNSRQFRNRGRLEFKHRKYDLALFNFKKAILNAPFPSEADHFDELSLAYASRAITYYQMKDYEKALFDANISIKLLPTIEMFFVKVRCLKILNQFKEFYESIEEMIEMANKNEIDLKGLTIERLENMKKANQQNLKINTLIKDEETEEEKRANFWIHPNCELKSTPSKGRHFIAKQFIPMRTPIIVEKPYSVVLFGHNILQYCNNCYKKIEDQIWPCRGCNEVVFCDQNCAQEALHEFHGSECGFAGLVFDLSPSLQHVFRMFIRIGSVNAYNLEESVARNGFDINEYLNDEKQQTKPQKEKTLEEKITEYKAVNTLLHHNEEHNYKSNAFHCLLAIEAVILLDYAKVLHFDISSELNTFVKFVDLMVKNQRRILTNVFGWFSYPKDKTLGRNHVANCHCFIASLMNHSCDPNTYWDFINQNITFTTTKDIKAGEEINDSYGPSLYTPFKERQQLLKRNYSFTCNCRACVEDAQKEPALQCLKYCGSVIYKSNTRSFSDTRIQSCILCGEDYKNIVSAIKKLECHRILFYRMKKNIFKNSNTELSSVMAEKAINAIIELSYQKSYELLADLREIVNIFTKKLCKYSSVRKYYKYFRSSIEIKKNGTTAQHLLLWTNIYYIYLKENQVNDEREWETGIGLHQQLIDLLKDVKNDGTVDENFHFHKNLIKTKKEELNYLYSIHNYFATVL